MVHAAARNIIVSTRNPREDFEVNIGGTLNVLLAARDADVKRVVYTSSCSIYGNPHSLPIAEDEQVSLLSPYAVSKFGGEAYCQAFYESYDVPTAVVRYSNVFGPGQRPDNPYCGVVEVRERARGRAASIHGDGEQTRDYTYVDDAVEATLPACISPKAIGAVYNVGTGRETSVNQLTYVIAGIAGADLEPAHVDRRDIDNIRRRVVSIERIRRELRVLSVTLENGLERTYAWLVDEQHAHSGVGSARLIDLPAFGRPLEPTDGGLARFAEADYIEKRSAAGCSTSRRPSPAARSPFARSRSSPVSSASLSARRRGYILLEYPGFPSVGVCTTRAPALRAWRGQRRPRLPACAPPRAHPRPMPRQGRTSSSGSAMPSQQMHFWRPASPG